MGDPFSAASGRPSGRPKLGGDVVTQTELARQLGIKRGRVTDYVKRGLPVPSIIVALLRTRSSLLIAS